MKLNSTFVTATVLAGLMLMACRETYAQPPASGSGDENGFVLYESFEGSSNTLGQVTRLNSAIGYKFNRYFSVDTGIPVYFLKASDTAIANGAQSGNGIGNVYVDFYLTLRNPMLTYESRVTGTAPSGNRDLGLTTGRATVDWNNYFGRDFGRLRPFANIGLANTVSDTPYFYRPFSTLGTVGHFEGGASYGAFRFLRIGASLYDVLPTGDQKVYSRLVRQSPATAAGNGAPMFTAFSTGLTSGSSAQQGGGPGIGPGMAGSGRTAFESQALTTGGSDLTRDNGYSAWLNISPVRHFFIQAGYTRSVVYRLDTVSFGIGFSFDLPGMR